MKTNPKARSSREADADREAVSVQGPFELESQNKRRFIRLEISMPMSLQKIKDPAGGFWPDGDCRVIQGLILNISGGGVLVDLNETLNEGDIVSMRFTLQEVEALDNVLGLVKRVDHEPDAILAGIEFITRDYLQDLFTRGEMDLLPGKYADFEESVRNVLNHYVRRTRVTGEVV
ncbi:MAG TPA: PilZ domain-containing protein [Acidobacteriota bacterium]|nr:PilZ domain-containing protein [Acidobacteriota bacterium]